MAEQDLTVKVIAEIPVTIPAGEWERMDASTIYDYAIDEAASRADIPGGIDMVDVLIPSHIE